MTSEISEEVPYFIIFSVSAKDVSESSLLSASKTFFHSAFFGRFISGISTGSNL